MESSPSTETWSTPVFEARIDLKVTTGNFSTRRKSVLFRCASRLRFPSVNRRGIDRGLKSGIAKPIPIVVPTPGRGVHKYSSALGDDQGDVVMLLRLRAESQDFFYDGGDNVLGSAPGILAQGFD